MMQTMHRLAEQAHPAFPVTIYYAFKQSESDGFDGTASTGWESFLDAIIRLILPANISIDDPRVQFELTRYLSDNWVPVIEKDVDGPNSLPLRLDGEFPNLGKFAACRRVARAIYMGSAPLTKAAHQGLEDRRVKLGCVMPGESPAVFGDAEAFGRSGNLPLPGWPALLVFDTANGDQAGGGPGRAVEARSRQGCP
jgi:hypothetical protein